MLAKSIDFFLMFGLSAVVYPLGPLMACFYIAFADSLPGGQSIGKKFFGLGVVSLVDGEYCGRKQSVIRNLPFVLPLLLTIIPFWGWILALIVFIPLGLFELSFLFRLDSGLRLGDVMADTTVYGNDPRRQNIGQQQQTGWFENQAPVPS